MADAEPDVPSRSAGSKARIVSLGVSAALLTALYRSMDFGLVGHALRAIDPLWLVISVSVIIPITLIRAARFYWISPPGALPGMVEALRLTLVASAANVFLPAKSGDLIKSYFVAKRTTTSGGMSVAVIVYDRLCDIFGLMFWCALGWIIGRPVVARVPSALWPLLGGVAVICGVLISSERAARFWPALLARILPLRFRRLHSVARGWPALLVELRGRRSWIVALSLLLWLVNLVQIWMFALALSVPIPFAECASLSAVALTAGLVPFTLAGLGARDVALVVLLKGYVSAESAAAMGILIATRNLLPPLAALPLMRSYMAEAVDHSRTGRPG